MQTLEVDAVSLHNTKVFERWSSLIDEHNKWLHLLSRHSGHYSLLAVSALVDLPSDHSHGMTTTP